MINSTKFKMSSRVNTFLSRGLVKFQGAMQKIESYRSNSAIRNHANETVKQGKDLSTSQKPV